MSKAFVHENELNVRVASILSESFGLDCRAERTLHRVRPDIRCFYNGFRIVIEASYDKSDAESDAKKRIEDGSADIAIVLCYVEKYPDVPEEELKKRLKESLLDVMILAPRETGNLEKYILRKTRVAEPVEGWFTRIRLVDLADIIKHAVAYLIEEVEVRQEVDRVKQDISDFIKVANGLSGSDKLREKIASILYKLYGFEVAETRDTEVVFGQAALAVLLSSVLYERVRHFHNLPSIGEYVKSHGPIHGLLNALDSLMKIDYEPAIALAIDVIRALPPALSQQVENIVKTSLRISQMSSLLARDFAGRIYHEITGDIAIRKGFATFYTEIPAAYMLSNLAIKTYLDLIDIDKLDENKASKVLNTICNLKIVDFACGSGTLLTASLYNASRIARNLCFLYDIECTCKAKEKSVGIEKKLIEEGIYGLDALRYAAQITALNLALMAPEAISKENVVSVYLGITSSIGVKGSAWLGSLELLNNVKTFGGLLKWIEGGLKGAVETVSTTSVVNGKIELLDNYDLVIMNPPFTRATGRVSKEFEEGQKGLFGFITDERSREIVKKKYDEVRNKVREELMKIAQDLVNKEPVLHDYKPLFQESKTYQSKNKMSVKESWVGLDQYVNIGQAGEGLLFLYLAYKYVKPGGVMAFVLPRNVLSGVSWFLARALLAKKFHVKYIVVSSDPDRGYNFSEGTSLSECLIVAKRMENHEPYEETVFINLLKKPKSALEALQLSESVLKESNKNMIELPDRAKCIVKKVSRERLLENLDNWNRFVFLPEHEVVEIGLRVLEGDLGVLGLKVPMTKLIELAESIGIDRHQFHNNFKRVNVVTPYPILYGGEEKVRETMLVKPNAYANCESEKASEIYKKYSGRILLPDRIRLNTTHVVALYSNTSVLSNIFYATKLRNLGIESEKALVYWFNTTWGLLSVIASREETEGLWMSLKMSQWKLLPVLDVTRLGGDVLSRLSNTFDQLAQEKPRRIVEQFSEDLAKVEPWRLKIDLNFLKSIDPNIDENKAKEHLYEIYKKTAVAFRRWVEATNKQV